MFSLTTSLIINSIFTNQVDKAYSSANYSHSKPVYSQSHHLTLMHGITFDSPVNLAEYYVSEKLDGVRAYWDGRHLWSRSGLLIKAPVSLVNELPSIPLDGELWLGRGNFNLVSGLIQRNDPTNSLWNQVSFAIFDLPNHTGIFYERYRALANLFPIPEQASLNYPVFAIPQRTLDSEQELLDYLSEVTEKGGEGLMLHKLINPYTFTRTENVLKLKPTHYTRATVLGYTEGTGKYTGKVGALHVSSEQGVEFFVGSGLTDAMRTTPPEVGSQVCIKHNGLTVNNKPRFPRYSRLCK